MLVQLNTFSELSAEQLHDIYQLRMAIFVVEQTCYYQDVDGLDKHPETRHLMFWQGGKLVAYARLLAAGTSYPEYISIGRIVTAAEARGQGLGHELVSRAIAECAKLWPGETIKISAQAHLQEFYGGHGFVTHSETYLEDGIPHVAMIRDSKQA